MNFYARKEIKDLLCYLKTVDNAADDLAVRRILNVPKRGIGATTVGRIQDYADMMNISFYDALRVAEEVPSIGRSLSKVDGFVTFIQSLKSKAQAYSVSELLEEIIDLTGYVDELKAEDTEESRARVENIDELISKTVSYEETMKAENREATLSGFLEEIALIADIDSVDENQDYVVLMTLHSAKGLEFPYVYLAGMEDGMFPSSMCIFSGDQSELEEERRLCYVGITRAKKELYLSCANSRMLFGQTKHNRPSRFLEEIDASLVEVEQSPAAAQTKAMRQRYMQQQNAYLQPEYGAASMRSTVQAGYSARYGGASHGSGAGGASRPARQRASVGGGFSTVQAGSTASVPRTEGSGAYRPGDLVEHKVFGRGEVLKVTPVAGDTIVEIRFDTAGVKKTMANYAPLKHISE